MRKGRLVHEKPTVWIGKHGLTEGIISEIRKQLEAKGYVKVKAQKSALVGKTTKEMAKEVAETLNASVIDVRGRTFILRKKRK